jgi:hypothetical protein
MPEKQGTVAIHSADQAFVQIVVEAPIVTAAEFAAEPVAVGEWTDARHPTPVKTSRHQRYPRHHYHVERHIQKNALIHQRFERRLTHNSRPILLHPRRVPYNLDISLLNTALLPVHQLCDFKHFGSIIHIFSGQLW